MLSFLSAETRAAQRGESGDQGANRASGGCRPRGLSSMSQASLARHAQLAPGRLWGHAPVGGTWTQSSRVGGKQVDGYVSRKCLDEYKRMRMSSMGSSHGSSPSVELLLWSALVLMRPSDTPVSISSSRPTDTKVEVCGATCVVCAAYTCAPRVFIGLMCVVTIDARLVVSI